LHGFSHSTYLLFANVQCDGDILITPSKKGAAWVCLAGMDQHVHIDRQYQGDGLF